MFAIEPVVYSPDHPQYAMAKDLIKLYDASSRAVTRPPAVYLLARSPVSPVSKMIWSNLDYFADRGCDVYVIFHKRQHAGSARRAISMYQDQFGDKVFTNVRLADFREAATLYEELQMGPTIAWAGGRLNEEPVEVRPGHINQSVTPGELEMFKATFGALWNESDSFAEAVGVWPASTKAGRRAAG